MRTIVAWTDVVPEHEGKKQVVWSLDFKPDGTQLVVAVGRRLVIYDAVDGEMLKQKTAHSGDIYTVSCSRDNMYIASGGADKSVSVWTYELSQKYTYSHAESIQALVFNPVMHNVLASCSAADFAIWSMPSSSLRKIRVQTKILCAAWTTDGQLLAMGTLSGVIQIRDTTGAEKLTIERHAPVWDLAWNPSKDKDDSNEILAVACWDSTISFYNVAGVQQGKDKPLGYDPTSVAHFSNGDYIIIGGSDRKTTLMTREGIKLASVMEGKDWVWCAVPRPKSNFIAVGTNDGTISMHSVVFSTVHGLYQDRYAFRENMTDVVVQHLVTEQRVRIKCRDYIKKIAVYKDRLAVQLPDRIIIYELAEHASDQKAEQDRAALPAAEHNMHYRVRDKIFQTLECNLLVVTSTHVILCQERKLQLYDFKGQKEREWVLEAVIRYIKVVGGPRNGEGLLVGLKNGGVLKIFVNNAFPMPLIKHKTSIRCLDLSMSRRKLAVVDEASNCIVYDVITKEALFQEAGANSVAWNTEAEDMLCFSGNGMLSIKTGLFPLHQQKLQGFVVGFNGSKIFCLHSIAMQTIDVPQTASLYRYIEERNWDMAYRVACLGVTESDWRSLGDAALRAMQLPVARAAFVRLQDMRYIELINHIENARKARRSKSGGHVDALDDSALLAEVMAYGGKYQEAAKLHLKAGTVDRAIDMFTDLRLWNEARRFAEESGRVDVNSLMLRQAAWCEETGDAKAAATILSAVGQAARAVHLLGERGMHNQLIELVRTLPSVTSAAAAESAEASTDGVPAGVLTRDQREALTAAGDHFRRGDLVKFAREAYLKLGDTKSLVQLHVDAAQWEEALSLARSAEGDVRARAAAAAKSGGQGADEAGLEKEAAAAEALIAHVNLCHAEWLAAEDRFEEAQAAYEAACRPDLASSILEQLACNALAEDRFGDAAYNYHRLSVDVFLAINKGVGDSDEQRVLVGKYHAYRGLADTYYAYNVVYLYVTSPFTSYSAEAVFHAARFVVNAVMGGPAGASKRAKDGDSRQPILIPHKISVMKLMYALARQSLNLEAYKLARFTLDRLLSMAIPPAWRDVLELSILSVQCKRFSDREDLIPVCYRCGTANPMITASAHTMAVRPRAAPRVGKGNAADDVTVSPTVLGDVCTNCGAAIVRSFVSFDPLPLVEFAPEEGVSVREAIDLLTAEPDLVAEGDVTASYADAEWSEGKRGDTQTLSFTGDGRQPVASSGTGEDLFSELLSSSAIVGGDAQGKPIVAPRHVLRALRPADVFILRASSAAHLSDEHHGDPSMQLVAGDAVIPPRFFKNIIPDIAVSVCSACNHFFQQEDFEFEVLKRGCCPYCRASVDKIGL